MLRASCRACGAGIRARYFAVELIAACLAACVFLRFGLSASAFIYAGLGFALIVITFIDLEYRIIPDVISVSGIGLGLLLSALVPALHPPEVLWPWDGLVGAFPARMLDSLSGVVLGGGLLWGLGTVWEVLFRKEAMGGGDVKLAAMMGAFLGWQLMLLAIFISALVGSIVGIAVMLRTKDHYIPYGPYLALGGLVSVFAGVGLIRAYLYLGMGAGG